MTIKGTFLSINLVLAVFIITLGLPELAMAGSPAKSKAFQPTRRLLESYIYEMQIYHYGFLPRLSQGTFDQPGEHISLCQAATGDLNGDGLVDAAVELQHQDSGTKNVHVIKIMLNDGRRLVDVGTDDLGMSGAVDQLHIAGGKVLGMLHWSEDTGLGSQVFSARVLSEPLMRARTYQIEGESVDQLGDRPNYCREFAAQVQKVWLENKKMILKACEERPQYDSFFADHRHSQWSLAAHLMKPVVIAINDPDIHLKTSSGDPIYDSLAYEAIDCIRRETPVPSAFIDTALPMDCTIVDDSDKCTDLAPLQKPIDLRLLRKVDNDSAKLRQHAAFKLSGAAGKFPERLCYKSHQKEIVRIDEGRKLEYCMKVAGDFDGDGQQDLVVLVRLSKSNGTGDTTEFKNAIVPLKYDHGRLRQLPQQFYCIEAASFGKTSDDLLTNVEVTGITVAPKKIVISYKGKRNTPASETEGSSDTGGKTMGTRPTGTYATEIDLTAHAVAQVRHNGKVFPPKIDMLTQD